MHHCRHYITSFLTRKKFQKCNRIKNLTTIHFNHIPFVVVALLVLIFLIKGNSPLPAIQMINTNERNFKVQLRNFNQKIFFNEISDYHQRTDSEFVNKLNLTICELHTEMFEQCLQDNAHHHSCCRSWCSICTISKQFFCSLEKKIKVFSISSTKSYLGSEDSPLRVVKYFLLPYHYRFDTSLNKGNLSVICSVRSYQIRYNTKQEKSTLYINRLPINRKRNRVRYKRYASDRGTKIRDVVSKENNGIPNNTIKL